MKKHDVLCIFFGGGEGEGGGRVTHYFSQHMITHTYVMSSKLLNVYLELTYGLDLVSISKSVFSGYTFQ